MNGSRITSLRVTNPEAAAKKRQEWKHWDDLCSEWYKYGPSGKPNAQRSTPSLPAPSSGDGPSVVQLAISLHAALGEWLVEQEAANGVE